MALLRATHAEDIIDAKQSFSKCISKAEMKFVVKVAQKVASTVNDHAGHCNLPLMMTQH